MAEKMTVEQLEVVISAQSKQFQDALRRMNKMLKEMRKETEKASGGAEIGAGMAKSVAKGVVAGQLFIKALEGIGRAGKAMARELGLANAETDKFNSAMMGLNTVASRTLGQEGLGKATTAAQELSRDGLMTVQDSATGLKNLLLSGFGLEESIKLMNVFKDAAAFGRQGSLSFGEAITSATEGVKNGNSILVDNAGITKNLSVILREAGYSAQDLMNVQSNQAVRQALLNGLMKEGNVFMGDAAKLAETSAGKQASLSARVTELRVEIGKMIEPIRNVWLTAQNLFVNGLTSAFKSAGGSVGSFVARAAGFLLGLVRIMGQLLSKIPYIGKHFEGLATISIKPVQALVNVKDSAQGAGAGLDRATQSAKDLKKELMGLLGFDEMNVLSQPESGSSETPTQPVIGGGGGMVAEAVVPKFSEEIEEQAKATETAFEKLKKKWEEFILPIKQTVEDRIIKPLKGWWELIETMLKPAFDDLKKEWEKLGIKIEGSSIFKWLKFLSDTIISAVIVGFMTLGTVVGFVIGGIVTGVTGLLTVFNYLKESWEFITRNLGASWEGFKKKLDSSIANIWSGFVDFVKRIVNKWGEIQSAFSGVVDNIKKKFEDLKTGLGKIGQGIVDAIKNAINNTLISRIRNMQSSYNSMVSTLPGGEKWKTNLIPFLERGGVVDSPTLAMIGENGSEAVVPLENNTEWIDKLASQINVSGGSQPINITLKVGERDFYEKMIDYINDKSLATNSEIITI